MSNNELQEILGARFREHTHSTDEAVWSAIEARLDADTSNRNGIWFWIFNGLAATVLLGCMIHTMGSKKGFETVNILTSSQIELNQEETTASSETTSRQQENSSASENVQEGSPQTSGATSPLTNKLSKDQTGHGTEIQLSSGDSNKTPRSSAEEKHDSNDNLRNNPLNNEKVKIATNNRTDLAEANDITIGSLAFLALDKTTLCPEKAIYPNDFSGLNLKKRSVQLPIHLGVEFSYLKKIGTFVNMSAAGAAPNTSSSNLTDQLVDNRQFEICAFAQFDFTRRFSTSFGLGYSFSSSSLESSANTTFATVAVTKKSELQLITLPVQTKFNFITRNRFSLNGGLTLQGEFGRITYSEEQTADASSSVSTTQLQEASSVVGKINFQQFALEPYLQLSVQFSPRISVFTNTGYRMYLQQIHIPGASQNRLNYFNADIGLQFRLR